MPVPVEFIFDDDSRKVYLIEVKEYVSRLELTMDKEPDEINFNPEHAILGEFEEVDIEDL